jgi:nitrogen fixation-related uncharacterized protein
MLKITIKHLECDKRGISNVIVVMLSLVLIAIIVANVILWSYKMNQYDWERAQEKIEIVDVHVPRFTISNQGSLTAHIVSFWIINATQHQHYDVSLFINSGENSTYTLPYTNLPTENIVVKAVTERGNIAILAIS